MLDRLKKQFGAQENSAELATLQASLASLQTQFDNVQSNLQNAVETITSLTTEKSDLEAKLAELAEQNATLIAAAQSAAELAEKEKSDARMAKLVVAVGTEKAEATFEAIKGLEDVAFNAVIAAMATSIQTEAQTELFKETGVAGDAEPAKEMTAEEKILRDKYKK